MKVFTIQFTEDELTELENVLDQHVYAEAIENKGSEGTIGTIHNRILDCLLYTSPSPRDATLSRMPSSA